MKLDSFGSVWFLKKKNWLQDWRLQIIKNIHIVCRTSMDKVEVTVNTLWHLLMLHSKITLFVSGCFGITCDGGFFTSVSTLDSYKEEIWTYKKGKQGKMETLEEILWFSWHCGSGPAAKQRSPPVREDFHFTSPSCVYCLSWHFICQIITLLLSFLFLDEMKPRHTRAVRYHRHTQP